VKPRILIVDHDTAVTQRLFWSLSEEYDVVTANDMHTAVRRATVYKPSISIVDLHMPPDQHSREVGMRILEYIKAHVPESKVLVMTAQSKEAWELYYAGGADEVLAKPFEIEQLLTTTRRLAPRQVDVV
jgi:DNA-binding response OmpR family regulator